MMAISITTISISRRTWSYFSIFVSTWCKFVLEFLFRFRFRLLFNRFTTREEEHMRRPRGAARPRCHTHVYTAARFTDPTQVSPVPPSRAVNSCDANRLATGLVLVPFLSAASNLRGPVPSDPLNQHVEVGTTQEFVRV